MRTQQQSGFSLIELMIALALGIIVVGAVLGVFINSQQMYRVQDAKARHQENGRYAMQFLSQHILNATYHGCASKGNPDINNFLSGTKKSEYQWRFEQPVFGINDASPPGDSSINKWLRGDTLTIRSVNGEPAKIDRIQGDDTLVLKTKLNLADGADLVMLSNCFNASIYQINSNETTNTEVKIASFNGLDLTPYAKGTVTPISTKSFFISTNPDNVPALYWKNSDHYQDSSRNRSDEVIDGIENMQLLYGIDTDNDGYVNKYVTANSGEIVSNWSNVLSVRVQLLLKSANNNLTTSSPQKYRFDIDNDGVDEEITAPDNHFYNVITQTFAFRNRVN